MNQVTLKSCWATKNENNRGDLIALVEVACIRNLDTNSIRRAPETPQRLSRNFNRTRSKKPRPFRERASKSFTPPINEGRIFWAPFG